MYTNTHSFQQERDDLSGFFVRDVIAPERLAARLGECGVTTGAAETLDSLASVESESLCFVVLAVDASHGLLFLCEKPYNLSLGFRCGLRPRLNLAPHLAETRCGVFISLLYPRPPELLGLNFLNRRQFGVTWLRQAIQPHPHCFELRFSERNQFRNPDVRGLISRLNCLRLDLFTADESRDYGVNGSHEIPELLSVEANTLKSCSHIRRFERTIGGFECLPHGIGESEFVCFLKLFAESIGKTENHLTYSNDFLFQFFLFGEALAEFFLKCGEFRLGTFKGFGKIKSLVHNRGITPCVQR
jgi:hypothetical protein